VIPITSQPTCVIDVKDKDLFHDDKIGTFEVDLREVETQGRLKKWYPIFYKEKPAGEILVETIYTGDSTVGVSQGIVNPTTTVIPTTGFVGGVAPTTGMVMGQPTIVDQSVGTSYVVNQGITTTSVIGGSNFIGGAPIMGTGLIGGAPIMGGDIPMSGIYGNSLQGDNVLPIVGGAFPATHSGIMAPSTGGSDLYAQEALLRGVDPLNVQSINRFNANQGLGYSGNIAPGRFGGNPGPL